MPEAWIAEVRGVDEDHLFNLLGHLPAEAAEALLEVATGGKPSLSTSTRETQITDPFDHPDAQRRFRVMENREELEQALDYPWEKWSIFLHPQQRDMVDQCYTGPARVAGSAGTGKTVVALHRAVYLTKSNPDARILLTTFSEPLANALRNQLKVLIGNQPRLKERLDVYAMDDIVCRLHQQYNGPGSLIGNDEVKSRLMALAREDSSLRFSDYFLWTEWQEIVDAWQINSWEAYRDVRRLGRKTRLSESQRQTLWSLFDRLRQDINGRGQLTLAGMTAWVSCYLQEKKIKPYENVVVDEAQDIGVPQLRFISALASHQANGLFFTGDLGQRIFQLPFSWKSLGVDIRGRSRVLKVNYRTSHQIRFHADRLLDSSISDVDGNEESRVGTISVFNGPPPQIRLFETQDKEIEAVATWLRARQEEGIPLKAMAVMVRSSHEWERARSALKKSGMSHRIIDERAETGNEQVAICSMHLAKGLEFRAVAIMACDEEIIPSEERIAQVSDEGDLMDVFNTERHLLYVAATRARDHLLITGIKPGSEFLEDMVHVPERSTNGRTETFSTCK